MQIKTNFQQKIEGHKWAVFRLKKLSVHALPGLCTLNIFEYEISLSCGKFRNHHREPLFGHGNTFDRGRPVGSIKEVNKEQPSYRNLSATATRVLQCTWPVAASWKYFSAIHPTPHLTSTHLTPDYVNTMILHLVSVLYTAVNVWNKNLCLLCLMNCFHYLA
jgi:hypothetical protein